jgi:hypothetical protein
MKFEEKLKQKYLYREGQNIFKKLYFYAQILKEKKFIKKSYSGGAQDLIINTIFKNLNDGIYNDGIYIDVGCYHPFIGNNTKLLSDKGWSGINIDLDFHTIDFFNFIRPRDENIQTAISDIDGERDMYFFHNRSAINSLSSHKKQKPKEIKKIQTKTLNSVIENSKFKNKKINLLCIDVEGHEVEVIKGFDLKKYSPQVVVIEFLDYNMTNMEIHNLSIETVLSSNIYKHMIENNYYFVNWLHSDLIFVNKKVRT